MSGTKTVALTGSDTIIIQNRSLADLADADCAALTFPENIMNVKIGKNGNAIITFNATGERCEVVLRVIRASADDKFLNNLLTQMKANPAGFVLLSGEFIKKVGDGTGKVTRDTYVMSGGVFVKNVEGKDNAEGDSEQAVSVYTLNFTNAPRAIG